MKKQQNLLFSRDMATVRIYVFLLLFLSQTWAETKTMKKDVGQDNGEINITADLWAELRDMVIQQNIDISNSKSKIEKLEEEKSANENKVALLYAEVEELKRQITETPKVAFSVALTDAGEIGNFNTDITLKFSKVLTNFGKAYDTHTGLFTAPLRGVYYFRFTGFSGVTHTPFGLFFYHNDKRVSWPVGASDYHFVSVSNGFALELEKGDVVYLVLPSGFNVYDDQLNRTVFSGFLIFPL